MTRKHSPQNHVRNTNYVVQSIPLKYSAARHQPIVQLIRDRSKRECQSWRVHSQDPKQQCRLSTMMHTINGTMAHQLALLPRILRTIAESKLDSTVELLVFQISQKQPHRRFNQTPLFDE